MEGSEGGRNMIKEA